jgi:hypothetical protein
MPVFVSRFSSNRAASALLQRIRTQSSQTDTRATTTNTREQREEQTRGSNNTQQTTRANETLLARTQFGQQIADRLQEARTAQTNNARSTRDTNTEQQTRTTQSQTEPQTVRGNGNTTRENNRTETQSRLQTPPGVGTTRSQADNNIERSGRLDRAPANPIREQILNGFARLRAIASGTLSDRNNTRTQSSANANGPVANRTDDRIRFLANNASQSQGRATGQQAIERQTPTLAIQTPVAIQASRLAQPTETPTAEDISRANTTEEIRNNLQQDASEIARGLTRDGTRQLQQTTQQTAQNAERAAESQRTETQNESRQEIRELQTQERDLSRELQQTQQDLRQERLRVQRSQSAASQSTTSSAAAIGTNVNILAG